MKQVRIDVVNQSNISVPPNVEEPVVLRRFLSLLVEQLDIVQGKRTGIDTRYVEIRELESAATALRKEVEETTKELEKASDTLRELLEQTSDLLVERLDAIELKNTEQDEALNNYVAIKACQLTFTVDASGDIVHNVAFNVDVASSTKISTGLYEFELVTTTFKGQALLDQLTVALQENIADSLVSQAYHTTFSNNGLPAGTFRIQVYAVEQGAGNKLQYTPYDLLPGDLVSLTALYDIPGSSLP